MDNEEDVEEEVDVKDFLDNRSNSDTGHSYYVTGVREMGLGGDKFFTLVEGAVVDYGLEQEVKVLRGDPVLREPVQILFSDECKYFVGRDAGAWVSLMNSLQPCLFV